VLHNPFQMDSIPYPVIIIDHSGKIIQVNKEAIAFAGMKESVLLNATVHKFFHSNKLLEADCPLCNYIKYQKAPAFYDTYYEDKKIWHKVSFSPVILDNGKDGFLQMGVDIAEPISVMRKRVEHDKSIRSLLRKIPVIYYRVDQHEMIQEMVGAALSKLDLNVDVQTGVPATDIFHDLTGKYEMIMRHGQYFFESQHATSQGKLWLMHYIFRTSGNNELAGFALDVTSMKRAQRAMLKLSIDKRNLARRMLQVQEDVRHEIARELHDEIGQSLTAVRVIASAMSGATNVTTDFYQQSATSISDVADKMYDSAHELMYRLHPVVLDTLGLEAAIQSCIHASGLHHTDVDIKLDIAGEVETMDQLVQLTIYRIVQESLTNIAKYAKASKVQIKMQRKKILNESAASSDFFELEISDNGIGFSEDKKQNKHGMGIFGLHERVEALGGVINISSRDGAGVSLFVRINLKIAEID